MSHGRMVREEIERLGLVTRRPKPVDDPHEAYLISCKILDPPMEEVAIFNQSRRVGAMLKHAGFDRLVRMACDQHHGEVLALDSPAVPTRRTPVVELHVSRYRFHDGGEWLIGIGQCPDCGTIHYATSECR